MSNQRSRTVICILAAVILDGCTTTPPREDGLAISENTPSSLTGSFAEQDQQISFDAKQDGNCNTATIRRGSGELVLRVALCNDGDTVDIGDVFHAVGPSGALLSGAELTPVKGSLTSPEVAGVLVPAGPLLRGLTTHLEDAFDVAPSLRVPPELMMPHKGGVAGSANGDLCRQACLAGGGVCLAIAGGLVPPFNVIVGAFCFAGGAICTIICPP
jgi:hypothetical protein